MPRSSKYREEVSSVINETMASLENFIGNGRENMPSLIICVLQRKLSLFGPIFISNHQKLQFFTLICKFRQNFHLYIGIAILIRKIHCG
jgi:hypothetical protein